MDNLNFLGYLYYGATSFFPTPLGDFIFGAMRFVNTQKNNFTLKYFFHTFNYEGIIKAATHLC